MKAKDYFDGVSGGYKEMYSRGIAKKFRDKGAIRAIEVLSTQKGETILDAGCGTGFCSELIKACGGYPFGIDISHKMIEETKKQGIEAEVHDLENLNLKKKFDKIICVGALEFCDDPPKAIENLKKHLHEDGQIVILFPRLSFAGILYALYHLSHGVHIKLFRQIEMRTLLEKVNLKIVHAENPDPLSCVVSAKVKE